MSIPKDAKYLLSLAQRFSESAGEKERENYELLSAATKSRFAAFLRGRVAALRRGGLKEAFTGETPEETKWKRERGKELREELERELDIAERLVDEARNLDPKATTESGASIETIASLIYAIRAYIAADATDFKDAYAFFEKSLKFMPTQETYFAYGLAFEAGGKNSEAIDVFSKAIDMGPHSDTGLNAAMEIRRLQHRK